MHSTNIHFARAPPFVPREPHAGGIMVPIAGRDRASGDLDTVLVYTDASIARGRGGIGVAARRAWDPRPAAWTRMVSRVRRPTNDINRLELLAIYVGLRLIDPAPDAVVYTDSQTALDQLVASGRASPKYADLARAVLAVVARRRGATFLAKVKAHSGNEGNTLADRLAGSASK